MTGRTYANVLPDPVAAAKARDRTGGMVVSDWLADEEDHELVFSRSTSNDDVTAEETELFFFSLSVFLIFSNDAILSLHPDNISGIAIFCIGVGPSINPKPLRSAASPTTASTKSVSKPNLDHSSAPSVIAPCLLVNSIDGRESSCDVRGAWKGSEDLEERLPSDGGGGAGVEEVVE